jgi:predicted lipoprotein with Yx(FWY)xxD motif
VRRLIVLGVLGLAVVVIGVAIAVASTGSSGGAARSGGGTISVKRIAGHGEVLVDAQGRALYRNDEERHGMVLCNGACVSIWQPLTAHGTTTKGGSFAGKLATVKRPDGRGRQVTFNGKLLYSFKLEGPGKVTGDGFKDAFGSQRFTWHVARPLGATSTGAPTTSTPTFTYP